MSVLNAAVDLLGRDTGHAINAANNIFNYGTLHSPSNAAVASPGMGLINAAHADPSNPAPIVRLASGSAAAAPKNDNNTSGTPKAQNPSSPDTGSGSGSSSSSSTTAPLVGEAQTALQQALDSLNKSNATVNADEVQQEHELDSNQAQQEQNYNQTLQTDEQKLADAIQGAKTAGSSDLGSLERMVAAMGGGGSSVARLLLPKLVEQSVAQNISGADETKAENDRSATSAWNTFLNNLASQRQQLKDQASKQLATNQAGYNTNVAKLNQIIDDLNKGVGSPSDLQYELQSTEGQIPNAISWTPSFSGTTPTYVAPTLSTFEMTPSAVAANAGSTAPVSGAAVIPYLASLTQQQRQNNGIPALVTATH